jgi:hypothetical protein
MKTAQTISEIKEGKSKRNLKTIFVCVKTRRKREDNPKVLRYSTLAR